MKSHCYNLTVTEDATLEWPLEESVPWTTGSQRHSRSAAAERRAAARARRRPVTARATDADPRIHDRAMSRASGWFFVPPHG